MRSKGTEAVLKRPPGNANINTDTGSALATFPEKGKPGTRVKDVKSLHKIYTQALKDDETSAYNRSLVRDAADGAPPYNDASLEQDGRFNLNFHDLSGLLDERNATYTDLIDSVPNIARFFYPETVDDSAGSEYADKAEIIAEEYTQLLRHDWDDFYPNFDVAINEMAQHGVSLAFYPDEETWKWKSAGMDEFLVPRQTRASEEAVDVLFIRDKISVDQFYRYIADEAVAKAIGWNIDESRKALVEATTRSSSKARSWGRYWSEVQDDLANNDMGTAYSTAQQVDAVHALVKEFDGSYSHYLFAEDGQCEDFYFQRRNRYASSKQAFTIFTSRVGRNGKFHSVRGDLWRAYPAAQASNRLRCAGLDSTAHSMAILLQPGDAESMEDFALVLNGPVAWLPPEAQVIQQRATPNLAQNALPMIQDLTVTMRENLGLGRPGVDGYTPNTKYGQQFQQVVAGALTGAQVTRFYRAWGRLLASQWERVVKIGPQNKRFPEITRFFERLLMRGVVPEEVLAVDRVEPYRAAGNGSVGMRMQSYDLGMQTIGMLDEVGRARFLRDKYAEQFGRDLATQYVGKPQKPRFVIDARLADLENNALRDDPEIVPMPGENDLVHAQTHLGKADEIVQRVMELLTQKGEVDPTPAMPELQYVESLLRHVQPHIEAISQDPTRKEAFVELRKAFQQISARWQSMVELAQRLTPSDQVQQDHLSKMQMKMQEHQLNMQIMAEDHQAQLQAKAVDLQHKIATRKAQTEAKIAAGLSQAAAAAASRR